MRSHAPTAATGYSTSSATASTASATPATPAITRLHIVLRTAVAVLGGYACTWGFIALGTAGLFGLGMAFHDAETLSTLLGFVLFLLAFLWAFAARSLLRVGAVLVGGAVLMAGAASLLQRALV